ncbi:DUF3231 family protein [Natronospora cellulosivora (SeqCode)]
MDLGILSRSKSNKKEISSVESFNIWNVLLVRYTSINKHQLYLNFTHDSDFKYFINKHIKEFEKEIKIFEEMAKKFKLKVPTKPPANIKFTSQIDCITDTFIFDEIYTDLMFELNGLKRAAVSSTTNDDIRSIFLDCTKRHLELYGEFYKFGKLKGWAAIAPAYKVKPNKKEEISVGEANHIWDHVNLRYDQKHMTSIFLDFTNDLDFQMIFKKGHKILDQQIETLENIALNFEIPLPARPPAVMESAIDPEMLEDKFIFRIVFANIQTAIDLHIRAILESTRNDKLRSMFFEFMEVEFGIYDNLIRYGKLKGWTHIPPMYGVSM